MRTPDGRWRVEVISTCNGQVFRVRQQLRPGQISRSGWAPTGQLRSTVADVQRMLGAAFAELVDE